MVIMLFVDLFLLGSLGILVWGFVDFFDDCDYFGENVVYWVDDWDVGFDGFGN